MNAITTSLMNIVSDEHVANLLYNSWLDEASFNPSWYPQGCQQGIKKAAKSGLLSYEWKGEYLFVTVVEKRLAELVGTDIYGLRNLRKQLLVSKYSLATQETETSPVKVKSNNQFFESGLYRPGFARVSCMGFRYDRGMLAEYQRQIEDSIVADIDKPDGHKTIDYQTVIHEVVDNMAHYDGLYFSSHGYADQRGRFYYTKGCFTAQNSHLARSLMELPEPVTLTSNGRDTVALFVAELAGIKASSLQDKLALGYDLLESKSIPSGRALWEQIWLERIFNNWNDQNNWTIPVELDATASAVQFLSVLLNDHALMNHVNLIYDGILHDFWSSTELPREHMKRYLTPHIYGSQATARELWRKNNLEITPELLAIAKSVEKLPHVRGIFMLKNHILEHIETPAETMRVNVGTESFDVHCTRFQYSHARKYVKIWNPERGYMQQVQVPNVKEPDLESFKRFFPSGLIHNLDSQIANDICKHLDWVIPNHDAFIVSPNDGLRLRLWYVSLLHRRVYCKRHEILARYLASINCKGCIKDVSTGEISRFSIACLK